MRGEILLNIRRDKDLQRFIREQPNWYRKLTRDPSLFNEFKREAKVYYKKTFPDRFDKAAGGVQMAAMLFSMIQSMNSNE